MTPLPDRLALPIQAAVEIASRHGLPPDRCEILQDGHTLVARLSADLVARIVTDRDGPRQGTEWFARENAIARHLTSHHAPAIPLHPGLPPGPHQHFGYTMSFWVFVTASGTPPEAAEIGRTLRHCHQILTTCPEPLPTLQILVESLDLLESPTVIAGLDAGTRQLLRHHLESANRHLRTHPHQALHGDAHYGNLMSTASGLLWTDWEDAFSGPVEWDLASIIWNVRILDQDHATADTILQAYTDAGGCVNDDALQHSLAARAAVMSTWYPILYPDPSPERRAKLQARLDYLHSIPA